MDDKNLYTFLKLYSTLLAMTAKICLKTVCNILHIMSYLGMIHIGKTRGKTRLTGAGLVRVRFWLPGPVPHVPYPQPTGGT